MSGEGGLTSLGASILLLAAIAIAVVVAFNLWQFRRVRKPAAPARAQEEAGRKAAPEATARAARAEPRLDGLAPAEAPEPAADGDDEPRLGELGAGGAAPAGPLPSPLSEGCDCIVELPLDAPAGGERLIAVAQGFRRAGGKPVAADGRAAGADARGPGPGPGDAPGDEAAEAPPFEAAEPSPFEALQPGRAYDALRFGVLLANRQGPLNAMEYSEFVSRIQAAADQLGVLADTPDMAPVLARARELDAACAELDAQLGVNVDAPEALGPAQLAALAAELAIAERGNNRYARLGPGGEIVFSVSLADRPDRLSFLIDVPRAPAELDPWGQALDCARACAARLGGRIVDDAGRPISEPMLAKIGEQVAGRQAQLEAAGFTPGSPLALRVFN